MCLLREPFCVKLLSQKVQQYSLILRCTVRKWNLQFFFFHTPRKTLPHAGQHSVFRGAATTKPAEISRFDQRPPWINLSNTRSAHFVQNYDLILSIFEERILEINRISFWKSKKLLNLMAVRKYANLTSIWKQLYITLTVTLIQK